MCSVELSVMQALNQCSGGLELTCVFFSFLLIHYVVFFVILFLVMFV